jgi:hypothetical protein
MISTLNSESGTLNEILPDSERQILRSAIAILDAQSRLLAMAPDRSIEVTPFDFNLFSWQPE